MADQLSEANSALRSLASELSSGRIARMDIYFIPYNILFVAAITPQTLEGEANLKASVEVSAGVAKSLVGAIDQIELGELTEVPDVRWGMVFWDQSGNRVHSLYLNSRYFFSTGRKGYVDGRRVGFNSSLINWLQSNYLPCRINLTWGGLSCALRALGVL